MKFNNADRYTVSLEEAYEPGSNDQVLKNFIGIKEKEVIEQIEARELLRAEQEIFAIYDEDHKFKAQDLCMMHECWLGNVYPFAGKYRTVNMSKDGFPFAGAPYIQSCMKEFEQSYLAKYTPCKTMDLNELAYALSIVHIEFIVIHPFREGNGRIGRVLATLMALQAGKPPLNFSPIDQTLNLQGFRHYISAIHAGVAGDYQPMQSIFDEILKKTIGC